MSEQLSLFEEREEHKPEAAKTAEPALLSGTIESIRCYKNDSCWAAVLVSTPTGVRRASGIMPGVRLGMTVEMTGKTVTSKYGEEFKADSFMETLPSDIEGIEKYLASGLIRNIGPVIAEKIISVFGEKTLEILDNEPERLREIKGIGEKRIQSIIESASEQRAVRSIMIWLKRHDLPNGLAARIYKAYGNESVTRLEENPYRLSDDIRGVGFKRADAVALSTGVPEDSPLRIRSGIIACLEDAASQGHTCARIDSLIRKVSGDDYLSLPESAVKDTLLSPMFRQVAIDDPYVYLPKYLRAERMISSRLAAMAAEPGDETAPSFGGLESISGIEYSEEQKTAIITACSSKIHIITGGPGTGKTVITNAIIRTLKDKGETVLLAAPTGRAAKRMTEVTGEQARTIHRLLGFQENGFTHNADNPLAGDTLIVDEASMIDTLLMDNILEAVPKDMRLILVGDVDQLPSVGAGSVLRDIIDSGKIPVTRLTRIYRQAQGSAIVMGAHEVNKGNAPLITNRKGTNLWLFREEDKDKISDLITDIVVNRIPKSLGIEKEDIQVLTPMRREWDPIGATRLNAKLQAAINPKGKKVATKGESEFRVGDKIMQTRNNYDKDIFNGDIGIVTGGLTGEDEDHAVLTASFDGRLTRFSQSDLSDVELAYACTVHKSQGSEYKAVVMPVHESQYIMLKRNLLYTGITRAKEQCVLVGTDKAIISAVRREDTEKRVTRLRDRIIEDANIRALCGQAMSNRAEATRKATPKKDKQNGRDERKEKTPGQPIL